MNELSTSTALCVVNEVVGSSAVVVRRRSSAFVGVRRSSFVVRRSSFVGVRRRLPSSLSSERSTKAQRVVNLSVCPPTSPTLRTLLSVVVAVHAAV